MTRPRGHRRPPRSTPDGDDIHITCLSDALGLVWWLRDLHGRCDAVALIRHAGRATVEVAAGRDVGVEQALDRVREPVADDPVAGVVLLSAWDDRAAMDAVARDHRRQAALRDGCAAAGWDLVDWVHFDGSLFRSLRLATDPRAGWPRFDRTGGAAPAA
jgi:hypothetical protein